jgi:hypothetical protein
MKRICKKIKKVLHFVGLFVIYRCEAMLPTVNLISYDNTD